MKHKPDFRVEGGGTVYLLRPLTKRAKTWCHAFLPEDRMTLGEAIAVEHRYIGAIVEGMRGDGLIMDER